MATPQNIRYIHPLFHTLTSPISLHFPPLTLYFPISSHSIFSILSLTYPTLSLISIHPIPTFSPQSPYILHPSISHLPYHAVQRPYTHNHPIPIHCPISPHTRPCNLSVLLYTILCTLTHSSIFPTYYST